MAHGTIDLTKPTTPPRPASRRVDVEAQEPQFRRRRRGEQRVPLAQVQEEAQRVVQVDRATAWIGPWWSEGKGPEEAQAERRSD